MQFDFSFSTRVLIAVLLGSQLLGCTSTGFNRGELKQQIAVGKPVYDEKEIKDAFDKKPNLPKPFTVAVYFKTPKSNHGGEASWRWTDEDKKVLEDLGAELKAEGTVSDFFPIMSSLVADEDLKSLRLVAAKHHADALFVIGGAS